MTWERLIEEQLRQQQSGAAKAGEDRRVLELIQQRLVDDIRAVFELPTRLGMRGMLEEIKRDYWKAGVVEPFEELHKERELDITVNRVGTKKIGDRTVKGFQLVYEYKEPSVDYEDVAKKKFGFYTEPRSASSGLEGSDINYRWEEHKFGTHHERIGTKPVLRWASRITGIVIGVMYIKYREGYDSHSHPDDRHLFSLIVAQVSGWDRNVYDLDYKSIQSLDPGVLKQPLIEPTLIFQMKQAIAADTAGRIRDKRLPRQIDEEMSRKLAEVNRAIAQGMRPIS